MLCLYSYEGILNILPKFVKTIPGVETKFQNLWSPVHLEPSQMQYKGLLSKVCLLPPIKYIFWTFIKYNIEEEEKHRIFFHSLAFLVAQAVKGA